jgi:DNA-binding helix-hairpin-helix protein with protein kinase domain
MQMGSDRFGWFVVSCAAAFFLWPKVSKAERSAIEAAWSTTHAEWRRLIERWNLEGSREIFQRQLRALETAKNELSDLSNERYRRLGKLHAGRKVQQLNRYLDRFRIDRARIKGIGPGRTSMLESFGIETAADVAYGKIIEIPGFGESLTNELLEWRGQHERKFRFNPNEPVDPRDVDALDYQIEARRHALLEQLREGPERLRRVGLEINAARSRLLPMLEDAWGKYQLAKHRRDAL